MYKRAILAAYGIWAGVPFAHSGIIPLPLLTLVPFGACSGDLLPVDCRGGGDGYLPEGALPLPPLLSSVRGDTIALCLPTSLSCVPRLMPPTNDLLCLLDCA